ncbi:MAG: segregation and condensation protein A [Candidatus Binatia bacterium]
MTEETRSGTAGAVRTADPPPQRDSRASPYRVRLDVFEGPLDLLLHLIKKNEVEITDIPIATITEQYIAYLEVLHELRLDVAGEFLVMAATLTLIKSRMLLPPTTDDEDKEEPDPRASLVQQLLEYQRYREAALELSERPLLRRDVFARVPSSDVAPGSAPGEAPPLQLTLWALVEALRAVLKRARPEAVHEIVPDTISLHDRARALLRTLAAVRAADFESLFDEDASRLEITITFLALLELMKMGAVRAIQEERYGRIVIEALIADASTLVIDGVDEYDDGGVKMTGVEDGRNQ